MKNWKKMMAAGLAVGLVATISIAGTLAYLTAGEDGTAKVTNTFVAAGSGQLIDPTDPDPIDPDPDAPKTGFYLIEHKAELVNDADAENLKYEVGTEVVTGNTYDRLLPGMVLEKDPKLTVNLQQGVNGYIFVKVKNSTSNLTVNIDEDIWKPVTGLKEGALATDGTETLYCYMGAAQEGRADKELDAVGILVNDQVTVAAELTGTKDVSGNIDMGELEFMAYACQAEGFNTPAEAFNACF